MAPRFSVAARFAHVTLLPCPPPSSCESAGLTDACSIGVEGLPRDPELSHLLSEVRNNISELPMLERAELIADMVATRMGGPVPISRMKHFSCDMHLAELKMSLGSNVIPIGKVRRVTAGGGILFLSVF